MHALIIEDEIMIAAAIEFVAEVRGQVPNYQVLTKPFSEQTLTYAVAASLGR
jgi:hypothetical protein